MRDLILQLSKSSIYSTKPYSWHIDNIILFASLTAAISIEKKGVRESMPDLAVVHHSLNSYERNLTQYFEE